MENTMKNRNKQDSGSLQILEVSASGRQNDSVSRRLSAELIGALQQSAGEVRIQRRDLSEGIPLVDEDWIAANFTAPEDRSAAQRRTLSESDALVAELQAADVIVIGCPIYNFGVPAALKAWIDKVARARETFRYTDHGPEGLLKGKKAYIVVASGGVAVDSELDFATPYLRHALRFLGITDVDVVAAELLNSAGEQSVAAARAQISNLTGIGSDAVVATIH
jgi:FMN-dependent NADH-azoreductase